MVKKWTEPCAMNGCSNSVVKMDSKKRISPLCRHCQDHFNSLVESDTITFAQRVDKMVKTCKVRSYSKSRDHNLTSEHIFNIWPVDNKCKYLDRELELSTKYSKYQPSLDRIDNDKGYVIGNIQVISRLANCMKNNATDRELLLFSKNILKEKTDDKTTKESDRSPSR